MNWIKRHKLWSLVFLYFGVGILFSVIGGALGIINPIGLGFVMGLFLWGYLFLCFILLKIFSKGQGKEDEKI